MADDNSAIRFLDNVALRKILAQVLVLQPFQ
jgi:hypothetical protein